MRLIHCADLHLDSKMNANLSGEKASERRKELLQTFTKMISFAKERGVSAILIAGDLFDVKNISAAARNAVKSAILNNPEIDFYYLKGNHDADSFLSELDSVPENLKLFSSSWTAYNIPLSGGKNVAIYGIEVSADNIGAYNDLVCRVEDYNIVMLHGQDSEHEKKDKGEVIPIRNYKNKNIDYMALGHIHSFREDRIDARGTYCYPGCLAGRGFDECGDHGFVYMEIDETTGTVTHKELINIEPRKHYDIAVEISGCDSSEDILSAVKTRLAEYGNLGSDLIKLRLIGGVSMAARYDVDYVLKSLEPDFYFVKIYDESKVMVDYKTYMEDESLKGEYVRLVSDETALSEADRAMIISYGLRLLSGEEV